MCEREKMKINESIENTGVSAFFIFILITINHCFFNEETKNHVSLRHKKIFPGVPEKGRNPHPPKGITFAKTDIL